MDVQIANFNITQGEDDELPSFIKKRRLKKSETCYFCFCFYSCFYSALLLFLLLLLMQVLLHQDKNEEAEDGENAKINEQAGALNKPNIFVERFNQLSSFFAMLGNPLAEVHGRNATFYHSILTRLPGFENSFSLYCRVMEAEAPLIIKPSKSNRRRRIGEVQRERRKRNHQQMEKEDVQAR